MSSTKSIIDEVLNTAVLASFAIPEVGAVTAAGIGTVGLLFNLFYTDAPTGDPSLSPVELAENRNGCINMAEFIHQIRSFLFQFQHYGQ